MYQLRPREDRGKTINDWLNSAHTFSFAEYFDPFNMGFSDLRVINDDWVGPDGGFGLHRHANMEIVSIVLDGVLEHKDSMGHVELLRPYEVQRMTAGTGIMHSEFNPSSNESVHFLQIWLLPYKKHLDPEYEQKKFPREKMLNKLCLLVSGDGREDSMVIHQDADIFRSILESDFEIKYKLPENRKIWIQVAKGAIEVNSGIIEAGDGLAIVNESGSINITGVDAESDFLLFNLRNLTI